MVELANHCMGHTLEVKIWKKILKWESEKEKEEKRGFSEITLNSNCYKWKRDFREPGAAATLRKEQWKGYLNKKWEWIIPGEIQHH